MVLDDHQPEQLCQEIIAQAQTFGADMAGIARVDDLKHSPSHRISSLLPDYEGVGTQSAPGHKRGIVHWPQGARAAVVMAIAHPLDKPELDWWTTGASGGNTPGNRLLMAVVDRLADWLHQTLGIRSIKMSYHIERGGAYMKDAAVLAGMGCIGKNNLLVTPQYGSHLRLRVMLVDADLPSTGPINFDPCQACPMPCRQACPQQALSKTIYQEADYGIDALPGRSGVYDRLACNRQMEMDQAKAETLALDDRTTMGRRVRYCRACEFACPVGKKNEKSKFPMQGRT